VSPVMARLPLTICEMRLAAPRVGTRVPSEKPRLPPIHPPIRRRDVSVCASRRPAPTQ
jgi:hypothetical protein